MFVRLGRRGQQHLDGARILGRQVLAQRGRHVQAAPRERQRAVTREHVAQEIIVRKSGMHGADHRRDGARRAFSELVLELVRQVRESY